MNNDADASGKPNEEELRMVASSIVTYTTAVTMLVHAPRLLLVLV